MPSLILRFPSLRNLLFASILFSFFSCRIAKDLKNKALSKNSSEQRLRKSIIDYAQGFIGAPYKYAGRTSDGFDCSGFTHYIMKIFNIELSTGAVDQALQGNFIPLESVQAGDLVFFSSRGVGGAITHVGMVTEKKTDGIYMVHASSRGVRIDNITTSDYWRPKTLYARDVVSNGGAKMPANQPKTTKKYQTASTEIGDDANHPVLENTSISTERATQLLNNKKVTLKKADQTSIVAAARAEKNISSLRLSEKIALEVIPVTSHSFIADISFWLKTHQLQLQILSKESLVIGKRILYFNDEIAALSFQFVKKICLKIG